MARPPCTKYTPLTSTYLVKVFRPGGLDPKLVAVPALAGTLALEGGSVRHVQLRRQEPLARHWGADLGRGFHHGAVAVQLVDGALGRVNAAARHVDAPVVDVGHGEAPLALSVYVGGDTLERDGGKGGRKAQGGRESGRITTSVAVVRAMRAVHCVGGAKGDHTSAVMCCHKEAAGGGATTEVD